MIDWTRINELVAEFGPEDFAEVVELFLAEVEGAIDQLDDDAQNLQGHVDRLHFLKGTALNLGFAAMSDLCRKGEEAARTGGEMIGKHQIQAAFEASRQQFEHGLPDVLAA